MKYNFFTIPAIDNAEAQQELNQFFAQHRVVTVEKNFVEAGANSYWSICVEVTEGEKLLTLAKHKSQVDYKEILNENDFTVFAQLRNLRKTMAESEGVPAYALFTNGYSMRSNALWEIQGISNFRS